MVIGKNSVVSIHYTLTDDKNQIIDSSNGSDPLDYLHGAGNIIPGLETALEGKKVGDKLKVTVPPEKGYGVRNPSAVQTVGKKEFQGVDDLKVGMQFQAHGPQGPMIVTVIDIKGDQVTIDGNHPLAGITLNFDVEVQSVRDATKEELAHGHVHGPGGHHHH